MPPFELPPGLTLTQKLAVATAKLCKPCCGGSGSGSGGDGPNSQACCGYCTAAGLNNSPPATLQATVTSCAGTKSITLNRTANCNAGLGLSYEGTSTDLVDGGCLDCGGGITAWSETPDLYVWIWCESTGGFFSDPKRWRAVVQAYSITTNALWNGTSYANDNVLYQGQPYGPDVCGVEGLVECDPFFISLSAPVSCGLINCDGDLIQVGQTGCQNCELTTLTLEVTL